MSAIIAFPLAPPAVRHPRAGFETIPPDLSRTELLRYFTFSELDRREIAQCRGAHNRIGFALLLGGVRLTGRFPHDFELLPRSLLSHVCAQLEVETPLFLNYPQRRPTRHEHMDRLKAYLGLRATTSADQMVVSSFVGQQVRAGIRLHELLGRTEQMLRQQHTVLPGLTVLERLINIARAAAEEELYQDICRRLDQQTTERILSILQKTPEQKHNLFQQLQRAAGRPSPEALEQELGTLDEVRALLPAGLNLDDISVPLLERLAGIVSGMPTQAMLRLAEPKRVALLVCWLWRLRAQMIDAALTIGNELIAGVFRRAKNAAARAQKHQYQRTGSVLKLCGEVVELLLDQTIPDPELRAAVFERWSSERIKSLATECQTLSQPPDIIYVAEIRRRYGYVRQFAPRLLEAFVLRAIVSNEPLLEAVDYLREQNQHKRRSIEADAPTDFVPSSWQARVCPAPGAIDRALWEICLLEQLRLALKSGNVHVPHSRAFQPLETYLLGREEWAQQKAAIAQIHELPLEFERHWPKVVELLQEGLCGLNQCVREDSRVEVRDGQFHVARLEKLPEAASAKALKATLQRMLQRWHLGDLLLEANGWTRFLRAFTRLTSGRAVTEGETREQIALLACLIAEGCNIGLSDMAVIGPGLSYDQLEEVYATYIREETLARATAMLVNFQLQQPLARSWGQGLTSSSDARVYGVPVRAINATFHPKYFAAAGRGVNVYTHVSDLWIPFYTQVITCHVRQAPYILDGLLYHATHLEPREHYTDTHGYTELIFAVCHLLGIRFAPRIKDLPEQRLWRLPDEEYEQIESVFAGKIKVELIRETWDEMVRLVASIKNGEVRASLIVSKLSAASHRNKLFRGLQELGRLLKTAYLAEYLRSEELRRRVLLGLNKGESLNSLARKLFFGGQGELRDRTYEDQLNAASSLNLLLAAIVVWNTVHLQACLRRLQADGHPVNEEDLRLVSPLMRRHIGVYGQYSFDLRRYESVPPADSFSY